MAAPPVVRPDPDPRGPDWDHPEPTPDHLNQRQLELASAAVSRLIPEPITDVPASPANYTATRLGYGVKGIIIHTMVGTLAATDASFANPARQASAHYGIACDGSLIHRYVSESDIAWHCGRFYPDASDPLANCNTIGIEHCDNGSAFSPRPDGLYQTSSDLVRDICQRYGIAIDRTHIRKHSEVSIAATGCPDSLDIDRIVSMAAGQPAPAPAEEEEMLYKSSETMFTGTFKVFAATKIYPDPVAVDAVAVASLAVGAAVSVDKYCYTSAAVQSADLGGGIPGPDYLWWHTAQGWTPDANLDTTTAANAPKPTLPAGWIMSSYLARESELAGLGTGVTMAQVESEVAAKTAQFVTMAQVTAAITSAIGGLPDYATKADLLTAINSALSQLVAGVPHDHQVLGFITTGPPLPIKS